MNRAIRCVNLVLAGIAMTGSASADSVLERLIETYDAVQSLSCEIRRDTPLPGGQTLRMLSRVHYQRPDRLHVENFSPVRRRIVSDGTLFRSYTEGAPRGFARPIGELSEEMRHNLRMVPGSSLNLLYVLDPSAEVRLDPTEEFPTRVGYEGKHSFAVLSLDSKGRLARFELFTSPVRKVLQTRTDFSAFQEILPGVWIARLQRSTVSLEGLERTQTTRIDNLIVNGQLPALLFEAEPFFQGVEFVDAFDKIGR